MMTCDKCKYCVQVSADEYKVRCANKEVAESEKIWVPEPSYCKYYLNKKYVIIQEDNK